jgi:hypothetical protein
MGLLTRLFGRDRADESVEPEQSPVTWRTRPVAPHPEDLFDWSIEPSDRPRSRDVGAPPPPPPPPPLPEASPEPPVAPISAALAEFHLTTPAPYSGRVRVGVPQVRLLLADGRIIDPPPDPVLEERLRYLAENLLPPPPPAVEGDWGFEGPRPEVPRVRLVMADGSSMDVTTNSEFSERIAYLARNLFPQ